MSFYNLEYRILDKLGRTKKTFHGGVFKSEEQIRAVKENIEHKNSKHKIAFDVYIIEDPFFKLS